MKRDCRVIELAADKRPDMKAKVLSDLARDGYRVTAVVPCGLNHQIYLERNSA